MLYYAVDVIESHEASLLCKLDALFLPLLHSVILLDIAGFHDFNKNDSNFLNIIFKYLETLK